MAFQASASDASNPTTSFSVTLPTTAAGDILILEYAHRGTSAVTLGGTSISSGGLTWTTKHTQAYNSSAFHGVLVWTRATGDHAGQTITGSGLTNSCSAIVTTYRGRVESGDPFGNVVGEENASADETNAGFTTTDDGCDICFTVAQSASFPPSIASQSCTSPGSLSERVEQISTGANDMAIAHASAAQASAGATGNFTWAQANQATGSWAYSILPAGAGGGGGLELPIAMHHYKTMRAA